MIGAEGLQPETRVPEAEPLAEAKAAFKQRAKRFGGRALKMTASLTAGAVAFGGYMYNEDVNEVKEMLAHTHPYVIENSSLPAIETGSSMVPHGTYETLDPAEKSYIAGLEQDRLVTIDFSGFGLTNVYKAKEVLSSFDKIGANWSVHYDNLGIDTEVIARMLVDKMNDQGIKQFGIYADSMGNIVGLQVAVQMLNLDPTLRFRFMDMDSPATCMEVLREKSLQDGYRLLDGIKEMPGAEYSRFDRMIAEIYLRWDRVHDWDSFWDVFHEVRREIFDNRDLPGNTLLAEQFQFIENSQFEPELKEVGELPMDERPVFYFMGAKNQAADDVVNTNKSYQLVYKWTQEDGLVLKGKYGIKDFHHGSQWMSMEEYHDVLGKEIVPQIVAAMGDEANIGAD